LFSGRYQNIKSKLIKILFKKYNVPNPILILNFKAYKVTAGKKGLALANAAHILSINKGVKLYIAPQITDTSFFSLNTEADILAQHCDPIIEGRGTGKVGIQNLLEIGVKGCLLNHSEYPQSIEEIVFIAKKSSEMGLKTCLCVPEPDFLANFRDAKFDMIAIEPPELIAGQVSVSKAKPQLLLRFFSEIERAHPESLKLCGAGIKNSEDVKIAKTLGADGILVSSGFTLAKDPLLALNSLLDGFF
jgi:triosephosphate isomerase